MKLFILVPLSWKHSQLIAKPLVLVSQFVDGDMADNVREVLSWSLLVLALDCTRRDVSPIRQSELSLA